MAPSHCTTCDTQIKARHNVPIFGWLWLRGKCASCGSKISPRYIIIEALTGVLFGLLAWKVLSLDLPLLPALLVLLGLLGLAFSGVVLSLIDLDTKTLPSKIIYPTLAWVAVTFGVATVLLGDYWLLLQAGLSALGLSAAYFILWLVRPAALGFGDVRLALPLGLVLGWFALPNLFLGFFLPFVLAFIYSIPGLLARKTSGKTSIALGPWMLLAAALTILVGDIAIDAYLELGGLK